MNLDAYLARIGLNERPEVSATGLAALQRAHRLSIPFENLDIRLGHGISLDPDTVFDKLVTRRRGGYCFEQNILFGRVISELGFDARPLLSRVWVGAGETVPPRTHTLSLVMLDGDPWIADAGFGRGYAPPMRLDDGRLVKGEDGLTHRLVDDAHYGWMLERQTVDGFDPEYSFTLDQAQPLDLEMSNHWTASWPESRHVQNAIASIVLPHGMASIFNRTYSRQSKGERVESEITGPRMMQMRLSLIFGIDLALAEVEALGLF